MHHFTYLQKSELISSSRDKVPVLIISLGAPGAEGESGDPGDAGGRLIGTWDPTHTMSPLNLTGELTYRRIEGGEEGGVRSKRAIVRDSAKIYHFRVGEKQI